MQDAIGIKTFVVLGMHRSATSLVAMGLHRANVHIGENLLGADWSNPLGHWENKAFKTLNEEILQAAGGSWQSPPSEKEILKVYPRFRAQIRAAIHKHERAPMWGWKDPRTTLTIKLYLPHLVNLHIVSIFRDPVEVATSLKRRNNIGIKQGMALAKEYNTRLIKFLSEYYGTNGIAYERL